ncbi:tyrosine-type recombinase/integrase [Cupriavidus basilensis]
MTIQRAKILTPAKIRHLLRVTESTSRHPERDALVLLLSLTCGMRITEIARIEVADVLTASGAVRSEAGLRAAITKGCRPRSIYLTNEKAVAALSRYLAWRYERGHGAALDRAHYRGMMPETRLILTHKGGPYELTTKRRIGQDGLPVEYLAADSLQAYVTGLYRAAGLLTGYSSHSGRRTFASRLLAQGHSIETVQMLLGHAELDHVAPYLEVSKAAMAAAIAELAASL